MSETNLGDYVIWGLRGIFLTCLVRQDGRIIICFVILLGSNFFLPFFFFFFNPIDKICLLGVATKNVVILNRFILENKSNR